MWILHRTKPRTEVALGPGLQVGRRVVAHPAAFNPDHWLHSGTGARHLISPGDEHG